MFCVLVLFLLLNARERRTPLCAALSTYNYVACENANKATLAKSTLPPSNTYFSSLSVRSRTPTPFSSMPASLLWLQLVEG